MSLLSITVCCESGLQVVGKALSLGAGGTCCLWPKEEIIMKQKPNTNPSSDGCGAGPTHSWEWPALDPCQAQLV